MALSNPVELSVTKSILEKYWAKSVEFFARPEGGCLLVPAGVLQFWLLGVGFEVGWFRPSKAKTPIKATATKITISFIKNLAEYLPR